MTFGLLVRLYRPTPGCPGIERMVSVWNDDDLLSYVQVTSNSSSTCRTELHFNSTTVLCSIGRTTNSPAIWLNIFEIKITIRDTRKNNNRKMYSFLQIDNRLSRPTSVLLKRLNAGLLGRGLRRSNRVGLTSGATFKNYQLTINISVHTGPDFLLGTCLGAAG